MAPATPGRELERHGSLRMPRTSSFLEQCSALSWKHAALARRNWRATTAQLVRIYISVAMRPYDTLSGAAICFWDLCMDCLSRQSVASAAS